jgi:hypothetical protein
MNPELSAWLCDTDPALRWQVERDLLHLPETVWKATQSRVAGEGFGARLLSLQDPDGQWDGGAFFPSDFDFSGPEAADDAGQPWTTTTWALNSLREWGVEAVALKDTAKLLELNCRWEYEQLPYWGGEVDCCINGYTLANGVWLGANVHGIAQWFVDHQMPEGGWNCEWVNGSKRASVVSTLNSLNGILAYQLAGFDVAGLMLARQRAEEYLLRRELLYRESTKSELFSSVNEFAYPFRSFYNALNVMDYFYRAWMFDDRSLDKRMQPAIDVIKNKQQPEGHWLQDRRNPGRVWFEVDVAPGEPSKWLTFYASRILSWWDNAS